MKFMDGFWNFVYGIKWYYHVRRAAKETKRDSCSSFVGDYLRYLRS